MKGATRILFERCGFASLFDRVDAQQLFHSGPLDTNGNVVLSASVAKKDERPRQGLLSGAVDGNGDLHL